MKSIMRRGAGVSALAQIVGLGCAVLMVACSGDDGASPNNALGAAGQPPGVVTGADDGTVGAGGEDMPPAPAEGACGALPSPGPTPLRRLTRFEYDNTVRDLLGEQSAPAANTLPGEEAGNGFGNDANALSVSRLLVDGYSTVAKGIAERATSAERLSTTVPCAASGGPECAAQFIAEFGARAFRRPLEQREVATLTQVFEMGQQVRGDFASGIAAVLETILQSPQFLYRVEFGVPLADAPGVLRPTDHEMATRLSYFFWGSTPDESLMQLAAAGQLSTPEQVLQQAQRLLDDPRARQMVAYFHNKVYGLDGLNNLERNPDLYPTYSQEMGRLMRRETETFLDYVIFEGDGSLSTIYGADFSFMNQQLAEFYGIEGVVGEEFQRVPLDTTQRLGVLTQAGIMTRQTPGNRSNPVVRAKWLMTQILCQQIPDPPPGLNAMEPEFEEGVTTRERFEQHRADPACEACHRLLDPVGYGFENFDGVGLWRDTDNGQPIDASGEVAASDIAGPFNGPVEFAQKVAQSTDARACFVGKWLTFGLGRAEQSQADQCNRQVLQQAFEQSGGNIKQLLLALTQTDAFLYRGANPVN